MKLKTVLFAFFCYFLFTTNSYATTASLDKLRTQFNHWQNSYLSLNDTEQKKLLAELKNYPLYPYAQYQYFTNHLDTATPEQINQFVEQNSDSPLATSLVQLYSQKQTTLKQWSNITKLNIDNSIASQCRYQYALFQQGKKVAALKPIKRIWLSGDDLSSACDPIFAEWSKSGEKTANTILLRVELALQKNNIKLARYLTEQLPDNYKTIKQNLLALYNNPATLPNFAKNIYPSAFSRKVVNLSFARFANANVDKAKAAIPGLIKLQKLNNSDEKAMYRAIASHYFKDSATSEQIKWRDQFISQDRSTSLIEREIRQALRTNNMDSVAYWLNLLSVQDRQKDEWQYWKARVLLNNNQQEEANKILNSLLDNRGFYAMYSAQTLNKPYQFDFNYLVTAQASDSKKELSLLREKYADNNVIQRITELRHFKMHSEAVKEWRHYLYNNINDKQYAELARYVNSLGWGEHSVQATIAGKLWENWLERFPVVYEDIFNQSLKEKSIPLSYALAIARQESALDAAVQSPAGARGLMQLMPGTAKDSAKKIADLQYSSAEQLYDPQINIQLGTYYLNYTYQLFENNRVLSSAAYNAGPNRVNRWLQETNGKLDALAFIESIPFTETRNYVKSVLVYDYIYALVLGDKPDTILYDNEINYKY